MLDILLDCIPDISLDFLLSIVLDISGRGSMTCDTDFPSCERLAEKRPDSAVGNSLAIGN